MSTLLTVTIFGAVFSGVNTALIYTVLRHHRRAVTKIRASESQWQEHIITHLELPPFIERPDLPVDTKPETVVH